MRLFTTLIIGFAALVALALAVAATAGELAGTGAIRAKDTRAATLLLGEGVYRVTAETVIRDARGARMRLEEIEVPDLAKGGRDPGLGLVMGRYQAVRAQGELILRSLDLASSAE